jgi:hypothetical protein
MKHGSLVGSDAAAREPKTLVGVAGLALGTLFALITTASTRVIGTELDELAADAGVFELGENITREVGRELNDGVIGKNLDRSEVLAAKPTLVGEGTHDLTGLHLLALSHLEAVRGHDPAIVTGATLGAVSA